MKISLPKYFSSVVEYRHGYNGMEKDDEVKGDGNSYTTEFRQYDSRVGRWLTRDPFAAKHPSWTPYKSMNDNPIVYVDPLGDDEILRVSFVNQETGQVITFQMTINTNIMTDGVVHPGEVVDRKEVRYYDYMTTMTVFISKDGNVTYFHGGSEILYENGAKDADWFHTNAPPSLGHTKSGSDEFTTPGGLFLVSESGEGEEKLSKLSGSLQAIAIDLLVSALSGFGGLNEKNIFASGMKEFMTTMESIVNVDPKQVTGDTGNGGSENVCGTAFQYVEGYRWEHVERHEGSKVYEDHYLVPIGESNSYVSEGSKRVSTTLVHD